MTTSVETGGDAAQMTRHTHTQRQRHRHTWEYAVERASALNATLVVCMKNPFGLKRSPPKRTCCQCEDVLQQPGRLHIVSESKRLFVVSVCLCGWKTSICQICLFFFFFTLLHYPAGKQLQPTSPRNSLLLLFP